MRKKMFVLVCVFLVASLLAACQPQALTAEDVEAIAANAAAQAVAGVPTPKTPDVLTQEEVSSIAAQAAEEAIASIPDPEVPESLTEEQVSAIIADALAKEETEAQEALSQYLIPLSWFAENGLFFENGVTVAWQCEQGARAWQGEIKFNVVPTDANIEVVEINCIQYKPGEEIPQEELITMGGVGTIWFRLPIETTLNQFGDCPCTDGDC